MSLAQIGKVIPQLVYTVANTQKIMNYLIINTLHNNEWFYTYITWIKNISFSIQQDQKYSDPKELVKRLKLYSKKFVKTFFFSIFLFCFVKMKN